MRGVNEDLWGAGVASLIRDSYSFACRAGAQHGTAWQCQQCSGRVGVCWQQQQQPPEWGPGPGETKAGGMAGCYRPSLLLLVLLFLLLLLLLLVLLFLLFLLFTTAAAGGSLAAQRLTLLPPRWALTSLTVVTGGTRFGMMMARPK